MIRAKRLIQFKTNIDIAMSALDRSGLGEWLADRLLEIADSVPNALPLRIDATIDPFPGTAGCRWLPCRPNRPRWR